MTAVIGNLTQANQNPALLEPRPLPTNQKISDVVLKFFKEKAKEVVKIFGYTSGWVNVLKPGVDPKVGEFSTMMGDMKNAMSATEVPDKVYKVGLAAKKLTQDFTWANVRALIKDVSSCINSSADALFFSSKFVPINSELMRAAKGVNFAATVGGCTISAGEQLQKIHTEDYKFEKVSLALINLARDVSYLAVGIVGLFCVITATPFVPVVMLGLLSSGLLFTITGFFYERIADPYKQHEDQKIVIQNLKAQNEYLARARVAAPAA